MPTTKTRKLHIGGKQSHPEWEIFDARAKEFVDHVGDAADLSRFESDTFNALYASHVLEHFAYLRDLTPTLKEWARVLSPHGDMFVSVPDMDVLCELFLDKERLNLDQRYHVMRMMFGGQANPYDFHYAGLNQEILQKHAAEAGLKVIKVVPEFNMFRDHSSTRLDGQLISLNAILRKA